MIVQGNALHLPIASGIVQTCVTSPPYYGLRDYGIEGQIGLEETPEAYIEKMVSVFREVRRVLRDNGTLWVNIGDSYNSAQTNQTGQNGYNDGRVNRDKGFSVGGVPGLKPKDLIGIPWMLAFALRADGWYLRSDIIWHKPNPMPESVTDRPTKAHEYIFLMSKSAKYYYDADAIAEPSSGLTGGRFGAGGAEVGRLRRDAARKRPADNGFRNKRDVWTVSTKPYPEAHFATFPPDLIEPCILAGSKEGDIVLDPFSGSGTTGQVAIQYRRRYVGLELNMDYIGLSRERTTTDVMLPMFLEQP